VNAAPERRVSYGSQATDLRWSRDVRYAPERWGNRPGSLWIAEDFGCCASG
jgi:hypothetical protein